MGTGGPRPGGGRPKGSKDKVPRRRRSGMKVNQVTIDPAAHGETPLEYMLRVMNNPEADQARRDRMAQAAAPFCHPRQADNRLGKGDHKSAAALDASVGKFAPPAPPKLVVDNK